MDFRLGRAIKNYLETNNLLNNADLVSAAGGVKNLVNPQSRNDADFVMRQIEISKRLHGIKKVILLSHTDCGAYGERTAFADEQAELECHIQDLKKAESLIKQKFPDLEIQLNLAKISPDGEITIENLT
jgi:carbonic anhydrase